MFMKQNLLAVAAAMAMAAYLPTASATTFTDAFSLTTGATGSLGIDTGAVDGGGNTIDHEFTNVVTAGQAFDITINYTAASTGISAAGDTYDLTFENTAFTITSISDNLGDTIIPSTGGGFNNYLGIASLNPGQTLTITVQGTANILSGIGGNEVVSVTPTTAVPEADLWAMFLLGLPLVSWMVRRKQAI
ncbi:MAG: hypothetical protein ABSB19_01490 [Methylomonas sp.]|jgi:hypothetical protein